jgi:hypothetical protein
MKTEAHKSEWMLEEVFAQSFTSEDSPQQNGIRNNHISV